MGRRQTVGPSRRIGSCHHATNLDPPIRVSRPGGPTLPTTTSFVRRAPAFSIALQLLLVASATAGPPSDSLLPQSTKVYVSVAHPKEFDDHWKKTQLGQMLNDDVMKAFVDDFE